MSDLIVLCPGALLAPAATPGVASGLPAASLPSVLRAATVVRRADDDSLVPPELPHEAWLRERLAVPHPASIEAATAHLDAVPDASAWWRVTPVHLHVGLDSLVLTDPTSAGLDAEEATALADALGPLLAESGFALHVARPLHWYLRPLHSPPGWQARSWRMSVGRSTDVYSPQGPDARRWRSLVNAVQMTWFEHPVNRRREAAGLPAVNSLWLDGPVPAVARPSLAQIITDDPAFAGLARLAGIPAAPLSDGARAAGAAPLEGDTLVISDAWQAAEQDPTPAAFIEAWQRFGRLMAVLGATAGPPRGRDGLRLVLAGERRWVELRTTVGSRWRFWRRNDPAGWWEPRR